MLRKLVLTLVTAIVAGSVHAESYTQYSYVSPWTVVKRANGFCSAIAKSPSQGDVFVLSLAPSGVILSMGNPQFQIPAGEYPIELSLNGSTVTDRTNMNATVKAGEGNWITVKLEVHQIQNLPKAALVTIDLAGKNHLLFLSDTAAMFRDLELCSKYQSDPLKSAR